MVFLKAARETDGTTRCASLDILHGVWRVWVWPTVITRKPVQLIRG